jgi:hypothetical protein
MLSSQQIKVPRVLIIGDETVQGNLHRVSIDLKAQFVRKNL